MSCMAILILSEGLSRTEVADQLWNGEVTAFSVIEADQAGTEPSYESTAAVGGGRPIRRHVHGVRRSRAGVWYSSPLVKRCQSCRVGGPRGRRWSRTDG